MREHCRQSEVACMSNFYVRLLYILFCISVNSAWELMGGFLKTEFSYGRSGSGAFCTEQCWPVGQTYWWCVWGCLSWDSSVCLYLPSASVGPGWMMSLLWFCEMGKRKYRKNAIRRNINTDEDLLIYFAFIASSHSI